MLEWYKNSKAGIFFDYLPHVGIRYILPSDTPEEKKSIKHIILKFQKDIVMTGHQCPVFFGG